MASDKQRVDEEAGIFGTGLDALLGNFAVDLEGFEIVLSDAIAIGIHVGERPARTGMALFGGVFIGFDRLFLLPVLVGLEAELEEIERPGFLGDAGIDVECSWPGRISPRKAR